MTAFGCVPSASVCPCARCVEAITSPSSIARQTPTATASWPIATCRKPGSSPARNRSSTFSSKRRISSISRKNSRSCSSVSVPRFSTFAIFGWSVCTLAALTLVRQWNALRESFPERWSDLRLILRVADEPHAVRANALLAPLTSSRSGTEVRFACSRMFGPGENGVRRLLWRLDAEKVRGELELVEAVAAVPEPLPATTPDLPAGGLVPSTLRARAHGALAPAWEAALEELPPDWSDIYAEVEITSSDLLERTALLMAPCNPARDGERLAFRFRCARTFGYGASPGMVRRCLERIDEEGIPARFDLLRALADTKPVYTQGPVWYVGGKAV